MDWPLKGIHIVERPAGNTADRLMRGDVVEVETIGGFVKRVDPVTRTATAVNQRFVLTGDDSEALTFEPKLVLTFEPTRRGLKLDVWKPRYWPGRR